MRKKSDNRRRPWSRTVLARPNDRGHVFHTGDAHRVLIALVYMEDTLKERHRINKELVAACEAGRLEKVDREGSPVDPRSSRSGMWRRVLSLAEKISSPAAQWSCRSARCAPRPERLATRNN